MGEPLRVKRGGDNGRGVLLADVDGEFVVERVGVKVVGIACHRHAQKNCKVLGGWSTTSTSVASSSSTLNTLVCPVAPLRPPPARHLVASSSPSVSIGPSSPPIPMAL